MVGAKGCWPHPGDGPIARARRVAWAYRARLERLAPEECAHLDAIFASWGQSWVAPRVVTHDDGAEVTAVDAADLLAVDLPTIRQLRLRGRLAGRIGPDGMYLYKVSDLQAVIQHTRSRVVKGDG